MPLLSFLLWHRRKQYRTAKSVICGNLPSRNVLINPHSAKQNEQNKASKLRLYEKYAAGSITKEAYIQQKAAADVKIAETMEQSSAVTSG